MAGRFQTLKPPGQRSTKRLTAHAKLSGWSVQKSRVKTRIGARTVNMTVQTESIAHIELIGPDPFCLSGTPV